MRLLGSRVSFQAVIECMLISSKSENWMEIQKDYDACPIRNQAALPSGNSCSGKELSRLRVTIASMRTLKPIGNYRTSKAQISI